MPGSLGHRHPLARQRRGHGSIPVRPTVRRFSGLPDMELNEHTLHLTPPTGLARSADGDWQGCAAWIVRGDILQRYAPQRPVGLIPATLPDALTRLELLKPTIIAASVGRLPWVDERGVAQDAAPAIVFSCGPSWPFAAPAAWVAACQRHAPVAGWATARPRADDQPWLVGFDRVGRPCAALVGFDRVWRPCAALVGQRISEAGDNAP